MKYIDTHAHIYSDEFISDRDAMLEASFEAGLDRIYMPNIDHTSIDGMLELEQKYAGKCIAMMGLHPCYVKKDFQKELYIVEDWLSKRPFSAIGEIGLDFYWDVTFKEQQIEAFKIQIEWAKKLDRPIVIHCRNSIDETIDIVSDMMDKKLRGIFHCYSGDLDQAKRILELGQFHLGIGGVATFKNGGLDKVLPHIPLDKLVLETDSPYLAPAPHRGKRNMPSYVPLIAHKVSEILQKDHDHLCQHFYENSIKIFS
jgi:TatD DNase family protein